VVKNLSEYKALYRKWRPVKFEDVVGQSHIVDSLKNSIMTNRVGHAYLFCGTRGTGKTSTAKIFARALNCENPQDGNPCNECPTCKGIIDGSILDVYEIDAASNNGVDNIREIRDEVIYAPVHCKYKVYIIDEAHMLTESAFNALLKTLEEPPAHAIFVLASTEPNRFPITILSRCQRYDFRRITTDDIARRLGKIAQAEEINITPDAIELVAELGNGSMRDALSILDQCRAFRPELKYADIVDIVGIVDETVLYKIARSISEDNTSEALKESIGFLDMGKDSMSFLDDLTTLFRNLLICKTTDSAEEIIEKSAEKIKQMNEIAEAFSKERIMYSIRTLGECYGSAKHMSNPQIGAEMAIVKLCNPEYSSEIDALRTRLEKLENRVKNGAFVETVKAPDVTESKAKKKAEPEVKLEKSLKGGQEWKNWKKALDSIKLESKKLYTYMFSARAELDGDIVVIYIGNKLAYDKVSTAEGKQYFANVFTAVEGRPLGVEVLREGEERKKTSTIDDLLKKKESLGDVLTIIDEE